MNPTRNIGEPTESKTLPDGVRDLCHEFDLEEPEPGDRWEFVLEEPPDDVGDRLTQSGCKLKREMETHNQRRYEYVVPEPGWPDPLGYVTTDEPEWVGPQHGWENSGRFSGRVRGSIPDQGDCDRHPHLPPDAYAVKRVTIYPPGSDRKWGSKPPLDSHEDEWGVCILFDQGNRTMRSPVAVYSTELGTFPHVTEWKSAPNRGNERRRIEFFPTADAAGEFVRDETGLIVPDGTHAPSSYSPPDPEGSPLIEDDSDNTDDGNKPMTNENNDTDDTDVREELECEFTERGSNGDEVCGDRADHLVRPAGWDDSLTGPKLMVCSDHMDALVTSEGGWVLDDRDPVEYLKDIGARFEEAKAARDESEAGPGRTDRGESIKVTADDLDVETDDGVRSSDATIQWITKPGDEIYGLRISDADGNLSIDEVYPEGFIRGSVMLNNNDELDGLIAALERIADEEDNSQ